MVIKVMTTRYNPIMATAFPAMLVHKSPLFRRIAQLTAANAMPRRLFDNALIFLFSVKWRILVRSDAAVPVTPPQNK